MSEKMFETVKDWETENRIPYPCAFCKGNSAVRKENGEFMTFLEYCKEVDTCTATIDWEKLYGRSRW